MGRLGFAPEFCSWIRECVSTATYNVLISRRPIGYVLLRKGLRQGDQSSITFSIFTLRGLLGPTSEKTRVGSITRGKCVTYGGPNFTPFLCISVLFVVQPKKKPNVYSMSWNVTREALVK